MPIAPPIQSQLLPQLLHALHALLHLPRLEKHQGFLNRSHALLPPRGVSLPLAGPLCAVHVQQLVGAGPDPFEPLLPQPDDFGRRLEELVGVVCSFRLALARFGPLAQRLLDLSRRVDGLADDFEEVLLRLDDVDSWELVLLLGFLMHR